MRIVFMGTPKAAVPTLTRIMSDGHEVAAVYTQPDRPSGRGNRIAFSPVKTFAAELGIPVKQPIKIRTPEALEDFRSYKAEVAIVVAYGRILSESFLTAFPIGAINVHFSLLPKYRGAAPVNWAIVNGESETGVTTMRMDAGLDTGDILLQRRVAILDDETSIELMERLSHEGAELLSDTLSDLDRISPTKQADQLASYAPVLKREDGLIDWNLTAVDITNRVRGFQPFPTAFTYLGKTRVTVWRSRQADNTTEGNFQPGEVVTASAGDLLVACGRGSIIAIDELQLEGKRRVSVRDFLNGTRLRVGDMLGK